MAPEELLKEMVIEAVLLLLSLDVPVKEEVIVCVSVPVVLSVG